MRLRTGILATIAFLGLVAFGVWWFAPSLLVDAQQLLDRKALETLVARAGLCGPLLIISLMTVAVVASPIPSAPIALAAGAAYGHVWGTVQVVIGAELGALIAFGLARVLGHDVLRRVFGDRVDALRVLRRYQLRSGAQPLARLAFRTGDAGGHHSGEFCPRAFWR
jgi:uncharacterized membrane protein YdjX (TVP38/TMEM64 family)